MAIRRKGASSEGPSQQISIVEMLNSDQKTIGDQKFERDSKIKSRRSRKAERQEFFIPVTGFVWFYPEEVKIINHPAFQRLGKINQLGQANLVFRGGTHKRMEHVLGAVHTVQRMLSAVNFNIEKAQCALDPAATLPPLNEEAESAALSDSEQRFVRLGALLHDIGHIAAGHTLEDELGLLSKHDEDERINKILDKSDWFEPEITAEFARLSLRQLIDELYEKYIPERLKSLTGIRAIFPTDTIGEVTDNLRRQLTASNIVKLLIRKPPAGKDDIEKLQTFVSSTPYIRYNVCTNMIGNTICADLVDYLYRDWYHLGRTRMIDDRILQYMEIRNRNPLLVAPDGRQRRTKDDEFVIYLGHNPKVRTDGVSAILGLLEWRYELAETALFHRTKLAAGAMLDRALYELFKDLTEDEILDKILMLSDDELLSEVIRLARDVAKRKPETSKVVINLASRLRHRRLFRPLVTSLYDDLSGESREYLQKEYGAGGSNGAAKNRREVTRKLERDFFLPAGSITMYCAAIKPKIAQVMIAVNDIIEKFSVYEDPGEELYKNKKKLSGGHLTAQIERFDRLWRVHFFIDRDVEETLTREDRIRLEEFIKNVLLTKSEPERTTAHSRQYAQSMIFLYEKYGFIPKIDQEHAVESEKLPNFAVAARSRDSVAELPEDSEDKYPNGARTIRSFFVQKEPKGDLTGESANSFIPQ